MNSIEELFEFILNHDQTIVYGNLGRKSNLIFDYLAKHLPTFNILIKSSIPTNKYNSYTPGDHCDLLIYLEPSSKTIITLPPGVSRLVVFTSHLLLTHLTQTPVFVSYYHTPTTIREEMIKNKNILALQDSSVQFFRGLKNQIDYLEVKSIGVNNPDCDMNINETIHQKTFFIVNVCNATTLIQLLLYIWDILDYLKEHIDLVERWLICFPENKMKRYEHFVQECMNKLFCQKFHYGNVTCSAELLALTPFYKLGVVDKSFDCLIKKFCKLDYIAPEKDEDAFKACLKYNLKPLTPQLFLI